MSGRRYELTDEQWDRIKEYFIIPNKNGRPYKNIRNTVNGIVWILKSGAPWRDLPSRYGDWNAVYKCFAKWQEEGIFEKVFQDLAMEADLQDISIDSTSVKVHKDGTGAKKGAMNA